MARERVQRAWAVAWWLAALVAAVAMIIMVKAVPLEATQVQFLQECQAAWGRNISGWSGASPDCSSATGLTCDSSGMILALAHHCRTIIHTSSSTYHQSQSIRQLRNYKLGGQIPNSLSSLRRLIYLDLASNQLPGSIPASVTALSLLQHLRHPEHLAEWDDPYRRREAGVVCKDVPKKISSEIREMFEAKIRARNQKARATNAAIAALSGKSAAKGKGKRVRMEDFYGEGGVAARRATDEAIVLYLAGTRTSESQCEHPLFLNMLRAVTVADPNYVPPKRHYVGGAGLLECKQRIEEALSPVTRSWRETGVTIASDMMQDKGGRAQMNIICINDNGAVFVEAVDCEAATKSGVFIVGVLRSIIERIGAEHVVALCTDGGSNYKAASVYTQNTIR
ncbi:unnamed protein product [Closterium sp. NIES-54]